MSYPSTKVPVTPCRGPSWRLPLLALQPALLGLALAACSGEGAPLPDLVDPPISKLEIVNLGFAILDGRPGEGFVAFQALESTADLDGDGGIGDVVLMVHRYTPAGTRALATSIEQYAVGEDVVVYAVREALVDQDLNGDGDRQDEVLHVHRVSTGVTTNVGLATNKELPPTSLDIVPAYYFAIEDGIVAFVVSELASGLIDYNGDGDLFDSVFAFHDVRSGQTTVTNLAAAQHRQFIAPGSLIGGVLEDGTDLNGDGDTEGLVLTRFDVQGGSVIPRHLSLDLLNGLRPFLVGEDFLLANVSETDAGDLNGDGDESDKLVFAYDIVSDRVIATGETFLFDEKLTDARFGAFKNTGERLFVYDADAENAFNTGIRWASLIAIVDGFLHFILREDEQGLDLNGDGDLEDLVSFLWDFERSQAFNLGHLAISLRVGDADSLVVGVFEPNEGDLNMDGDLSDGLLFRFDRSSGDMTLLEAPGGHLATLDERVLMLIESENFETDLNGDGDRNDVVLFLSLSDGTERRNLGLAGGLLEVDPRPYQDVIPFAVFETAQGEQDLNGDGDAVDRVLFLLRSSAGLDSAF